MKSEDKSFNPRRVQWSVDDEGNLTLWDVFCGIGIETDQGRISICQRDSGIEVWLKTPTGDLMWSSTTAWGNDPQNPPEVDNGKVDSRPAKK